jgi:RNA recognition motif-containing protein
VSLKIPCSESGKSRRYGFVEYSTEAEATRAVSEMDGHVAASQHSITRNSTCANTLIVVLDMK